MAVVMRYLKNDFEKIQNDGFIYNLSADVLKIIQSIATEVGSPEYIKSPKFEKQEHVKNNNSINNNSINRHKKNKPQEFTNEDWNSLRNTPTHTVTVINKKEGIDASIDQIRKHLNKMTSKTYSSLKEKIVEEIEQLSKTSSSEITSDINKIGEAIFTIASGNSFFSTMYAELFKDLMKQFNFMRDIFLLNFDKFTSFFTTIEYCDPNKDYDKFCANNKFNEQRRAISLFYVNLMLQDIIEPNKIIVIICDLQKYMNSLAMVENNKNIVDELSEVLYILITNSCDKLKDHQEWPTVVAAVKSFSLIKPGPSISVSNKSIFKHMDMLDVI